MKTRQRVSWIAVAAAFLTVALVRPLGLPAQASAAESPVAKNGSAVSWSVEVQRVDGGNVNIEPAFQIAIYEGLVNELRKTKRFQQVLREGDRNAGDDPNLLILKTTAQKYTPGSETRRAVTTVSGATKLTVRSQLCARDGTILVERTVNGNVRFIGSNLRATHNLARNVAKAIKQSSLPQPPLPVSAQNGQF